MYRRTLAALATLAVALLLPAAPAGAQSLPSWASPGGQRARPPAEPSFGLAPEDDDDAPPTLPPVPVDGGLGLLALAGGAYAARRLSRRARG